MNLSAPPDDPIPASLDLPTAAGRLVLTPVAPDRDFDLIHTWMNDPAVAAYWELDGPPSRVAGHLAEQQMRGHTRPFLARLAGRPIGYWEIYRAAEDRLAAYYPAQPGDFGIHLLIGEEDCRGHGLGSVLLAAVCDALQESARGSRVVAEPDERNIASVRSFVAAGFHEAGTLDLPEKRATLVIRDVRA